MAGQPSISIVDTTNFEANKHEKQTTTKHENTTSGSTRETNTSQPQIAFETW